MIPEAEVERYVKDPSLLVELCREVVDRLDAGGDNSEKAAMEAQLRAIAHIIDKLDKQGVPVPDVLRAEKTRLAAALSVNDEANQALEHLAHELEGLLKELKSRIGRPGPRPEPKPEPGPKPPKSRKTDKTILRFWIIEALQYLGGSASKNEVLQHIEQRHGNELLPGDLDSSVKPYIYAWRNNVCWERNAMKNDGILKAGSPRGIWELSEGHL